MSRRGVATRLALWLLTALVAAAALVAFARLSTGPHFPRSEDAAGHLYKAVLLFDSLRSGEGIPALFPGWYAGAESFRYYPIVPYLLALPAVALLGDDQGGAILLVTVTGLVAAGAGVLLWRRALGWPLACLGAVLAAVLPDPVRVAFAEGNVPRVIAHALFLPTIWSATEAARGRRGPGIALVVLLPVTVLCHALIGAVAATAVGLVILAGAVAHQWPWRAVWRVGLLSAAGLALAGWWLIPSLTGGLAEIDSAAVRRALFHFSPLDALGSRSVFYLGIVLVGGGLIAAVRPGRRSNGWPYIVAGLPLTLAPVDPLATVYLQLPVANMLWPIRLVSAGQALLLLGLLHVVAEALAPVWAARPFPRRRLFRSPVAALLLLLLVADTLPGLAIIRAGTAPADQLAIADRLARTGGWRLATLDLSRLGSAPTFLWSGREQLFGWGYQGARNAAAVADINEALERGLPDYLVDRLDWWGVDDIVLDRSHPELEATLAARGFALRGEEGPLRHWGRDGGPRAVLLDHPALGIGDGARVWAAHFPQVVRGPSSYIDDYHLDELRAFERVVVAGPRWHDRARAEALIRDYAADGGQVVVDLAGAPDDPLTRAPRFLGIYSEPLPFPGTGTTLTEVDEAAGASQQLAPFADASWLAPTYAGLDRTSVVADYAGERAEIIGQLTQSGGDASTGTITFIGLNLAYHALLTGDQVAVGLLARHTGLEPGRGVVADTMPLSTYRADGSGYHFTIELDRPRRVVIPVARHDGLRATVGGVDWTANTLEDAVVLDLPAGRHDVMLTVTPGGNRLLGIMVTAFGLVLAALVLWRGAGRAATPTVRSLDEEEPEVASVRQAA